ncbi:MAG: septum formation initiator family protein [Bacillota bacterium]|nr:septum formation initiator family protein [Bacillota bacterium]
MRSGTQRLFRQVKGSGYRRWLRTLARLGVAAFCLLLLSSFLRAGWELWTLKHEEARLRLAVETLREQNRTLLSQMEDMQQDAYIQKAARELGLVNPGEILYFPVKEPPAGSPPATSP